MTVDAPAPLLDVRALTKRYSGVTALHNVDLRADAGEVHAIVGANGAGKSTFMNLLSGITRPTSGEIRLDSRLVTLASPADAQELGIATVHQEFSLVPQLSVARNVFLGREPIRRGGFVDQSHLLDAAGVLFARFQLHLDPRAEVGELSIAEQQLVEIARALSISARILILDEPTAVLSIAEQQNLFGIIGSLKAAGMLILYVSHRLSEVLSIADRVTVLRDGAKVATRPVAGLSLGELVLLMIGGTEPRANERVPAPPVTGGFEIAYRSGPDETGMTIRGGEIVGLAGLVGAGRSTFARSLIGAARSGAEATVMFDGAAHRFTSPREARKAGIIYLTEDRKRDGLFANLDIVSNTTAASLSLVSKGGLRQPRREKRIARSILEQLRLKARGLDMVVGQLSGGNQQKVLLGRALLQAPKLLICDEPTRGVDIGAKREVHDFLRELASKGMALLVISSEIDELLALSHKIVVMRDCRIVAEMPAEKADEAAILIAASGGADRERLVA